MRSGNFFGFRRLVVVPIYMAIFTCCFINSAGSHVFPITTVKCLQLGIALWSYSSQIEDHSRFTLRRMSYDMVLQSAI